MREYVEVYIYKYNFDAENRINNQLKWSIYAHYEKWFYGILNIRK